MTSTSHVADCSEAHHVSILKLDIYADRTVKDTHIGGISKSITALWPSILEGGNYGQLRFFIDLARDPDRDRTLNIFIRCYRDDLRGNECPCRTTS